MGNAIPRSFPLTAIRHDRARLHRPRRAGWPALLAWGLSLLAVPACLAQPADGAATDPAADAAAAEVRAFELRGNALPGATPFPQALRQRIDAALASRGASYVPRTRHLDGEGGARFTNRLILESSPYLRQHAHNPVNWFPWGDEAFAEARRLGRPILLSIGYSTCHWCHVMEEESFEDEEIATFLNRNYVAIKVDREERPDLDDLYMTAVQLLTGRGGWPMTTWLDHDGQPFYGGTYFPPRDGDRGAKTGFLTLLQRLQRLFVEDPQRVGQSAAAMAQRIRSAKQTPAARGTADATTLTAALEATRKRYDPVNGGPRGRPKFPSSFPLRFVLRRALRSGEAADLAMAVHTLHAMADGGIYDQVGGGFHRYATDARWLVPHFEKMLYDNALLAVIYVEGYQASGDERFATVAREILDYVAREMTSPEGAFYSATDADSLTPQGEREEGYFFTWTAEEIRAALDPEAARVILTVYGVTPAGNFEGRNVLHRPRPLGEAATRLGIDAATLDALLSAARRTLYAIRSRRPAPLRDEKILTSWNGLMISGFARASFALDDPALRRQGERAAEFILSRMQVDGRLRRSYMDGQARHNAYLDDYAFLIAGLLDLYEAGGAPRWLAEAIRLQAVLDRHYTDAGAGGYFMTSDDHESLLARDKPLRDGAEPSGNSVALLNLVRLEALTTDDRYRVAADRLLAAFGGAVRASPTLAPELLLALDFRLSEPREVAIVTAGDPAAAEPLAREIRRGFYPHTVHRLVAEGSELAAHAELVPWLEGKVARDGLPTAYVCTRGVCRLPTTDTRVFARQLREVATEPAPEASSD